MISANSERTVPTTSRPLEGDPHKVTTVGLLDECSTAVKVAGSCNAILRQADGSLLGDIFDGAGFARGLKRKGFEFGGAACLVVRAGGVGSAIAASVAAESTGSIALFDTQFRQTLEDLATRSRSPIRRS